MNEGRQAANQKMEEKKYLGFLEGVGRWRSWSSYYRFGLWERKLGEVGLKNVLMCHILCNLHRVCKYSHGKDLKHA